MDVMQILEGFLFSAAGIIVVIQVGKFVWDKLGEMIKRTDNTIDDKLYTITPRIVADVLDEFDLGTKTEKILTQIFIEHQKIPADTTKMEQAINNELEKVKKN